MGSWNTGRRLPQSFLHFSDVSCSFLLFGFGGGGGGGGDKNFIHTASMHKTLAFAVFSPLCDTARGCGTRHVVTSVHANSDDAQNTGIYRVFASLYNVLRKDVEEEKLSQASMPLAEFNTKAPYSVNIEVFLFYCFLASCLRNPPETQVKRTLSHTQTPRQSRTRVPGSYA